MDHILSLDSLGLGGSSTRSDPPNGVSSDPVHTSPQLVHQGNNTAIYRLNDKGFKVILDPNPSEDQILKILHEQNISNFLPWSCRKRQVTDVTSFDRRPALSFKWVNGITLKEWLQKVQMGPRVDMNVCLRAAMAVAKTLSDFHAGGVVYNGLTPENVILAPYEGEYAATFMDLSNCLIYRDDTRSDIDNSFEKKIKEGDLKSLGLILNQIFRGEEGSPAEVSVQRKKEKDEYGKNAIVLDANPSRGKRGRLRSQTEGLPIYLGSLISALIDTSTPLHVCYQSAKDVFSDLKILAENGNGCLSKCKLDDSTLKSRLRLQEGMFYGRGVQMSIILHLFQSSVVLGNQPLMATIAGYPGTGKSTLVSQIKKPLTDLNGCFIEGKFDKHVRPDAVLASALNSFFGSIIENNKGNEFLSMKWRIHDAIGSGSNSVLLEVLPNLQKWIAEGSTATDDLAARENSIPQGMASNHRLKFLFCKLVGAIACRAHPLVLFLDDLQWADEMTLDVIRMMMTDPDIHHFLLLGCYRDNEVKISHPLNAKLKAIQDQGVSIVTIKIGPIEKECVNTLLSEAMCMPRSLCRPLSDVVHSKTGGIILFILRFLASLNDNGDLWFSMSARRWMYNLEEIRLKEIHGDVVSHMTEHMRSLSKKMQMGLKFIACLGPKFDKKVLEKVEKDNGFEDTFFKSCTDFGFLQSFSSTEYVWAHDQIQQAAYDLIPLPKRESFHLLVGTRLFLSTPPSEMKRMIFFIVDNMNRGSNLLDDVDQKYEVSQLNLEAGEKALSASAFHSAAKYLLTGLALLGPESWEARYSLTIGLYDAASEALFVTGDFSRLSELIDEPLMHARSFQDKLNILNNLVRALAASSKFDEGITKCISILDQLREVIPTDITDEVYAEEVAQVKDALHGKSRQDLLSLPMMSETRKLAAMQFMNHALTMTFVAKPCLNHIIVLRMVKMSIEHGICNISAFAFACYGALLVSEPLCDVERGHRMGRMATEMMKQLSAVEMTPRLYATVYGFINIWKEPWQAGQGKHLEAYQSGATTGDMEYATTNLYQYASTAIYGCGENLKSISKNIQSYAKRAFQCNQRGNWGAFVVLHQLTLDLIGIDQNAFSPYSNGTTEESYFERCRKDNAISFCRLICCKKKYVAFFRGDLDAAAKMYELSQDFPSTGRLVGNVVSLFVDGLIGFFFARKHGNDKAKWTNVGVDAIQYLRTWVISSEWNFSNKLHLLEAEFYFLMKDDERAMRCYQASIKSAREHRFIHEEGLAEEKVATYLLHKTNHDEAMGHFINAKRCYEAWGAHTLVQRVDKAIAILSPLCNRSLTSKVLY